MPTNNTFTGNRALLKIEGQLVGYGLVQNADIQEDYGTQKVSGLGKAEGVELVIGEVSYRVNISKMFLFNETLTDLGFIPEANDYLASPYLQLEILDNVSGATIRHLVGGKPANCNMTVNKHAPGIENASLLFLSKIK
jgi:hypothetical protein